MVSFNFLANLEVYTIPPFPDIYHEIMQVFQKKSIPLTSKDLAHTKERFNTFLY